MISTRISIVRPIPDKPVFVATGPVALALRAGASIAGNEFPDATPVALPVLAPGRDYAISIEDGRPVATLCADAIPDAAIGGFHFAPGGNASGRSGGDASPQINPFSIWDAGFRPSCPDPRGMTLVDDRFWVDIYLLGTKHRRDGTSRCDATIADGRRNLPSRPDGDGKADRLDFATARDILAAHGKQLLTYDEFRVAAVGVTEKTSADEKPTRSGLDAPRTSRWGLMQATGNLWVWGTDGDPDDPRASLFGGSWINGSGAGSRYADLDDWPGGSDGNLSARGRSDHLNLA